MPWRKYRVSSGFWTLDNMELEADSIPRLLRLLREQFGSRVQTGTRFGLDLSAAAAELRFDGAPLALGWDNWSGLFIMAQDPAGDRAIEEMEPFLSDIGNLYEVI